MQCVVGNASLACAEATSSCCSANTSSISDAVVVLWCCPPSSSCGSSPKLCNPAPVPGADASGGTAALWASIGSIVGVIIVGILIFCFVKYRRAHGGSNGIEAAGGGGGAVKGRKKKGSRRGNIEDGESELAADGREKITIGSDRKDRFNTASRMDRFVEVMTSMSLPKEKTVLPSRSPYHHDHQIYVQRLA